MNQLTAAARLLWQDKRALAILLSVALAWLGALALFALTSQATLAQVGLTFLSLALAPLLFFYWQALAVSYANGIKTGAWLRGAVRGIGRLLLASVPLLLLAGALVYWFGAWASTPESPVLTVLRLVVGGFLWPLVAVHLWRAAWHDGVLGAWQRGAQIVRQALAPETLLLYAQGWLFFALLPYLLLWARLPGSWGRGQIVWLVLRLIVALALACLGWSVTVIALGHKASGNAKKVH